MLGLYNLSLMSYLCFFHLISACNVMNLKLLSCHKFLCITFFFFDGTAECMLRLHDMMSVLMFHQQQALNLEEFINLICDPKSLFPLGVVRLRIHRIHLLKKMKRKSKSTPINIFFKKVKKIILLK